MFNLGNNIVPGTFLLFNNALDLGRFTLEEFYELNEFSLAAWLREDRTI